MTLGKKKAELALRLRPKRGTTKPSPAFKTTTLGGTTELALSSPASTGHQGGVNRGQNNDRVSTDKHKNHVQLCSHLQLPSKIFLNPWLLRLRLPRTRKLHPGLSRRSLRSIRAPALKTVGGLRKVRYYARFFIFQLVTPTY